MQAEPQFRSFTFAGFHVDVEKREILDADGNPRRLVGKPFDVLAFMAIRQPRFVSVQDLLDEFWADDDDSGDADRSDPQNVYKAISKIRQALGDESCIVTERHRGF